MRRTYRDFQIEGHRDLSFAWNDAGTEFSGDLYDVETAIDRWHEDQWREHVAEVGDALVKLDAILDELDRPLEAAE